MFIDKVTIRVEGGAGGSGAEAFRRESGTPRGGPAGGDGGDGGDIVLVCDPQLGTLLDLRYRSEYQGERGGHGEGSNKTGARGEDVELRVPPGTIVTDADTGEALGELLHPGVRMLVAAGGRGGRGNARFATSTRQAPRYSEPGRPGEARSLELTLKLIADVGLVGEPNAGKSTLLATVSAAKPKVAGYAFTTLTPNLGVVSLPNYRSFVIADIPGIIEGAHEGRGLGHRFLRHIERTRTLAVLVPFDDPDPQRTYDGLREELVRYSPDLGARPHCVVVTKADLAPGDAEPPSVEAPEAWGAFLVSSVSRRGVGELLEGLWARLQVLEETADSDVDAATVPPPPMPDEPATSEEEDWWDRAEEDLS